MSALSDLNDRTRIPKIVSGRVSAQQREDDLAALREVAVSTAAGTSRRRMWADLLVALLGQGAVAYSDYAKQRAAEAMLKAAEAELARAQIEAEGGYRCQGHAIGAVRIARVHQHLTVDDDDAVSAQASTFARSPASS